MSDIWRYAFAFIGAGAIILGLIAYFVTITIAFKKIEEIEKLIATPGKQIDNIRNIWRGGLVGRWIRAMHVAHFFFIRNVPRYGPVIASRMGDELEPVPINLKLWAILPVTAVLASGAIAIIAWRLMKALGP